MARWLACANSCVGPARLAYANCYRLAYANSPADRSAQDCQKINKLAKFAVCKKAARKLANFRYMQKRPRDTYRRHRSGDRLKAAPLDAAPLRGSNLRPVARSWGDPCLYTTPPTKPLTAQNFGLSVVLSLIMSACRGPLSFYPAFR